MTITNKGTIVRGRKSYAPFVWTVLSDFGEVAGRGTTAADASLKDARTAARACWAQFQSRQATVTGNGGYRPEFSVWRRASTSEQAGNK